MTEAPERTAVYRIRSEDDALLYIGMTNGVPFRWNGHQAVQPWWDELCSLTVEWYDTRAEAAAAEKAAILAEQPKYNVTYLKPHSGRPGANRPELPPPVDWENFILDPQDDDLDLLNIEDVARMIRVPYPSTSSSTVKAALRRTGGPQGFMLGTLLLFRKGEIRRWIAAAEASQRDSKPSPAVADDAPATQSAVASAPKRRRPRRADQPALFDVNGSVA